MLKGFFLVLLKGFIDYTEVFFGFTGKLSPDELGTEQEKTALYPRARKNMGTEQKKTALYPRARKNVGTEQEKTALYPRARKNVGTEQEKTALYPNHWKYYQLTDTRNMMMEVFGQTIF
ncbi:MAG: hypothetical protein PUB54_06780 [Lachnospiraceae bacterium]|nr:hypothetical protein [Lachnospiraceae bacterium]